MPEESNRTEEAHWVSVTRTLGGTSLARRQLQIHPMSAGGCIAHHLASPSDLLASDSAIGRGQPASYSTIAALSSNTLRPSLPALVETSAFDPNRTFDHLRQFYLVLALPLEARLVGKGEIPCL